MMKKIIITVTVIAVLLLVGDNYYQTRVAKSRATQVTGPTINTVTTVSPSPEQLFLATVNISGFDCPTCPVSAEYALKDQKGVLDARVTQSGQGSKIIYDANSVTIDDFRKVVDPFTIEVVSEGPTTDTKLN